MSDIGRFPGNGQWSGASAGGNPFDMQRRDMAKRQDKSVDLGNSSVAGGQSGEATVNADLMSAFERSIRTATKSLGGSDDSGGADTFADARLLAQSETTVPVSTLPSFADLAPPQPAALSPSGSDMVATVTRHIEAAIRADMRPSKDAPLTLQLAFPGEEAGLFGLTLSMTATTLDVVLDRVVGDMSPELLAAAAALSDQLRLRFGKRVVRILDRVVASSTSTAPALTRLFAADEGQS
jgi:hypothetical protein